jgi:hypothetical protein
MKPYFLNLYPFLLAVDVEREREIASSIKILKKTVAGDVCSIGMIIWHVRMYLN